MDRIKRVWRELDAWHSTGPAGLDAGVLEHVNKYGSGGWLRDQLPVLLLLVVTLLLVLLAHW